MKQWLFFYVLVRLTCGNGRAETMDEFLAVNWKGPGAQIEVGGPYAGVEMHGSSYLPTRVSFFYPLANSLDSSGDYWKRHLSRVMTLGLQIGEGARTELGRGPFPCRITPYSAEFEDVKPQRRITAEYRFCKNKPAMVFRLELTNTASTSQHFKLYSHLDLSLRTSSSYLLRDSARSRYDEERTTIFACYDEEDTGKVCLFLSNASLAPTSFSTSARDSWCSEEIEGGPPAAAFLYDQSLKPGEKMSVVQIIGSCRQDEATETVDYLRKHYKEEVRSYEKSITDTASSGAKLVTGDAYMDHASAWARAVLGANLHYLDGEMVPMPCPAEYNFFFSHDILLTSLSALHFDPPWVGANLERIGRWAKADGTIPHARYAKEGEIVTEYAGSDNWNNLWFVIVTARYFFHSGDSSLPEKLLPCLRKSLQSILSRKKDGLIWAFRPDWWDIGTKYGPRAYMTILTIRALREMSALLTALEGPEEERARYDAEAEELKERLTKDLWDESLAYLISTFEDGTKDEHYYIGSLLAPHFALLDDDKALALVNSAAKHLVDEKLGVYNAVPMDFHRLGDFFSFHGDEAGPLFTYMNGGMWSHGIAWYVLALSAVGKKQEAFDFLRRTMTVKGIMDSPNGQPAMFEYRIGDHRDPQLYGKVDKPQFLWAAGWYLYSWYHLFISREDTGGTSFDPFLPAGMDEVRAPLVLRGRKMSVRVSGRGHFVSNLSYNGTSYPSLVVPMSLPEGHEVEIVLGIPHNPYLARTSALLKSASLNRDKTSLKVEVTACPGQRTVSEFISMRAPVAISINGIPINDWKVEKSGLAKRTVLTHAQKNAVDTIGLAFP